MSRWADEVKTHGVADVAAALGLTVRDRGVTNTSVSPCPACQAPQRGASDPRGPIGLTADGLGWRCHRCQATGDAVTLAALVVCGAVPWKGAPGWHEVRGACEAHGLCTSETASGRPATPRSRRAPTVPPPAPRPAPERPPAAEVQALWDRCLAVTDDLDVSAWLLDGVKRRIAPALVADRDLARALPPTGPLPAWCQFLGVSWQTTTHRVIVPLYGVGGHLESLHARAVAPISPKHKAASPKDASIRGLVMADAGGRAVLSGAALPPARHVLVAEGVPDFLTWATHFGDAAEEAPPVLGLIAGSWTPEIAATIPTGWTVIIRTHADDAGNKYAETIRASLAGRCECRRPRADVSAYPRIGVARHARR